VSAYGQNVFASKVPQLKAMLRADQGMILVPAGADPWRDDPAAFFSYARDPQVKIILAFAWTGGNESGYANDWGTGIRNNGMADVFRKWAHP
jgi:hypothetical protein